MIDATVRVLIQTLRCDEVDAELCTIALLGGLANLPVTFFTVLLDAHYRHAGHQDANCAVCGYLKSAMKQAVEGDREDGSRTG